LGLQVPASGHLRRYWIVAVVYVFGPTRRVSVSDKDARYLVKSWLGSEPSLAGIGLNGATKAALESGEEVRLTEEMRQVLLGVLDKVAEDGRLGDLRALHDEALSPIEPGR
jgi:hypothetical protein